MNFGTEFRKYREEYLHIKQIEAALALKIDPASLSNYERDSRDFSVDMLPIVKETFDIPNDYFHAMVLGTPLKSVRASSQARPLKAQEVKVCYMNSYIDKHRQLFEDSSELWEYVAHVSTLTEKDRRNFLNSTKSRLALFLILTEQQIKKS